MDKQYNDYNGYDVQDILGVYKMTFKCQGFARKHATAIGFLITDIKERFELNDEQVQFVLHDNGKIENAIFHGEFGMNSQDIIDRVIKAKDKFKSADSEECKDKIINKEEAFYKLTTEANKIFCSNVSL